MLEKSILRLGVIGAGGIAERHLDALGAIEGASVVGIASRTRAKAEALAARYGNATVVRDVDALVRMVRPDALLMLVSASSMYSATLEALELGLPLFIEKPPGLSVEQTRELAAKAGSRGIPTMVGYNRRYYSVLRRGIELVKQRGPLLGVAIQGHERIGAVRRAGKHPQEVLDSWLYANSTHTIDLLRFFGGEPRTVSGFAYRRAEPVVDGIAAVLEYESGALGQYCAYWHSPAGWRVELYGDGIYVEFSPLEKGHWTDSSGNGGAVPVDEEDNRFKPGFVAQMRAFCALARGGALEWPAVDLNGAVRTMCLAERLVRDVRILGREAG